jgi:hypothetical protein
VLYEPEEPGSALDIEREIERMQGLLDALDSATTGRTA